MHRDALEWANRVRATHGKPPLTDAPNDSGLIMGTLDDEVTEAGGVGCEGYGRIVRGEPYEKYIVVTQYEEGEWKSRGGKMDPYSYFVEGRDEEIAKEMLERESE